MPLPKAKIFKRRGTGDLTEAIEDVLERRDTKNLKKYVDKIKNSEKFLIYMLVSIAIFSMLVVTGVAGVLTLFTKKHSKPTHTANVALLNNSPELHLMSSISKSWKPSKENLMFKSNNSYVFKFTPKKKTPFYFRIGDASNNPMYTFGAKKGGDLLPFNATVPAYNGIGTRSFTFKPDELSEHQLIFQIQTKDRFALKIMKTH